jgi:hypothetical protein
VTYIGWVALAFYCALYVAVFAALARFTSNLFVLAAGVTFRNVVRGTVAFHRNSRGFFFPILNMPSLPSHKSS